MLKLTFLGTSDSIPSVRRNHSAILLNYNEENILVDCGEGTQRQFRKAHLNPCKVTRLLISHWHGDHVLGIPGLLQTLALSDYNKTLYIYGPKGTKKFMKNLLDTFVFKNDKYDIKVEEVSEKKFLDTNDFYIEAKSLNHGIPCNGYTFVRKGKLRIDKKKLEKSGLPSGPLLQKIKQGKNVSYNGKKFKAKDLVYEEKGKKISFILDTSFDAKISKFVKDSDLMISEATFDSELEEKAKKHKHMTSKQAGEIAKKAKVGKLVLTHISARYDKNPKKLLEDARKVFKNSFLVKDLEVLEI